MRGIHTGYYVYEGRAPVRPTFVASHHSLPSA